MTKDKGVNLVEEAERFLEKDEDMPEGALSELLAHVKNRPSTVSIYPMDVANQAIFLARLDEWFDELVGKTQELSSLFAESFEKCAYIDNEGKPAFLCTTCRYYHGFKRGCEWKLELLGGGQEPRKEKQK